MESLREQQFHELCHAIVEEEDGLRELHSLSLSAEERIKRRLTVLYAHLREVWPIVPGRGTREELGGD